MVDQQTPLGSRTRWTSRKSLPRSRRERNGMSAEPHAVFDESTITEKIGGDVDEQRQGQAAMIPVIEAIPLVSERAPNRAELHALAAGTGLRGFEPLQMPRNLATGDHIGIGCKEALQQG
jgi:hypothetical protein